MIKKLFYKLIIILFYLQNFKHMNIYFIKLNEKKYNQYKTYDIAYENFEKLILQCPESYIEIGLEEFCEFGHLDSHSYIDILCIYKYGKIHKIYNH